MIVGGRHNVSATPKQLTDERVCLRVLTIRLVTGAGNIIFGDKDGNVFGFLKAEESWTWGPNAGTVYTDKLYISGTADDTLYWTGIEV